MRANEFVKKFGLNRARYVLKKADAGAIQYVIDLDYYASGVVSGDYVILAELQRLVKSHEIVASWGGLSDAKIAADVCSHMKYLKQAIEDVESCQ